MTVRKLFWIVLSVDVVLVAAAVALFELVPLLLGAPQITVPEKVNVRVGQIASIKWRASGDARWFVYKAPDNPSLVVQKNVTLFAAGAPGEYILAAYTARRGTPSDLAFCRVVVGSEPGPEPSPPPGPGPGPGPPPPPPVDPTDPLFVALKAAWEKEPRESRDLYRSVLVSTYREIARIALDERYANVGELADAIHVASDARLSRTSLASVRRVAGDYANAQLPRVPTTKLDGAIRAKVSECYTRLAQIVEAL